MFRRFACLSTTLFQRTVHVASSETDIATPTTSDRTAGTERRWNVSNVLSLVRLLLVLPAGAAIMYERKVVAVAIFVLAALTDYLDGYFARRLGQISEFGKILDPLADKIFVAGVVILLYLTGIVPLWLLVPILGRDLLILLGGLYVERRAGVVLPSNWTGKWAVGALSFAILLLYLGAEGIVVHGFIGLTFAMLALSLGQYAARMIATLKKADSEAR